MHIIIQLIGATPVRPVALALACFAISQSAQAVTPTPDGGYPGGNTAEGGAGALGSLTTGTNNTALGSQALFNLTTGIQNTATGAQAPRENTADQNTADGFQALNKNTIGEDNTAIGWRALFRNTTGTDNTANGAAALFKNTEGSSNTGIGVSALVSNIAGNSNTGIGVSALESNTAGMGNTGIGTTALMSNTDVAGNTAVGMGALSSSSSGNLNTALGVGAGSNVTTAHNVTAIGAGVSGANVDRTTWIGSVFGVMTQNAVTAPVVVSADGQLGTSASSERFKKDIATMEQASEVILSLRPVTFHYKTDTKGAPQFGLIAEEVAKVNPALVLPDKEGKPYTVRYDAVNVMLLNEFLKARRQIDAQQKQIEALTAGLQKVSAQVELSKSAPQTVLNNR